MKILHGKNLLIISELTQNTKIRGLQFDDISHAAALHYATMKASGLTLLKRSELISPNDFAYEFSYAFLSHSQAFSNNIVEMISQLNISNRGSTIT